MESLCVSSPGLRAKAKGGLSAGSNSGNTKASPYENARQKGSKTKFAMRLKTVQADKKSDSSLGMSSTNRKMNEMVNGLCNSVDDGKSFNQVSSTSRISGESASEVAAMGLISYESGDIYEGQLMNGRRNGTGKMKFINGDLYQGTWRANQMCDADGVYTYKNGNEYRGGFKTCAKNRSQLPYGCFEGQGQLKVVDVGIYIGRFKTNCAVGPGSVMLMNGKIIELEADLADETIEEIVKLVVNTCQKA